MSCNNEFVFHLNYGAIVLLPSGITMAERRTAIKNFNNAVVVSQQPLVNEAMFEVCIEGIDEGRSESLEIGVTTEPPNTYDNANQTQPLNGTSFQCASETCDSSELSINDSKSYTQTIDLRCLKVGDCVGIMRKRSGSLQFFINGVGYGKEHLNVPENIYAVINCYQENIRDKKEKVESNQLHVQQLNNQCSAVTQSISELQRLDESTPKTDMSKEEVNSLSNSDKDICVGEESLSDHIQSRISEIRSFTEGVTRLFTDTDIDTDFELPKIRTRGTWRPEPENTAHTDILSPSEEAHVDTNENESNTECGDNASAAVLTSSIDQIDMNCPLRFHPRCGLFVRVINEGKTALRPNAFSEFNNAITLTNRPLKDNELFEVKLDRIIEKWAGSIEIGLTSHQPHSIEFPTTITNILSKTIVFCGNSIVRNGVTIRDDYPFSTDNLKANDKVSASRKTNGDVHFYVNGRDLGVADHNFDSSPFGIVDVYGRAARISIINISDAEALCTSHLINADRILTNALETIRNIEQSLLIPSTTKKKKKEALSFHLTHHGKNIEVSADGKRASRINPTQQFNHAVLFSNRPLEDNEVFMVEVGNVISSWVGSIEMGVTTHNLATLQLPATMTDLDRDTWMLSGCSVIHSQAFLESNYPIDMDEIKLGMKLGMFWKGNGELHFMVNGVDKGVAATNVPAGAYGFFDLYGKCTQVRLCGNTSLPDESTTEMSFYSSTATLKHHTSTSVEAHREDISSANHVFYTRCLNFDEKIKVTINAKCDSYMKSLTLGLSTCKSLEQASTVSWKWCDDVMKCNSDVTCSPLTTSLRHLEEGCNASLQRRRDGTLHCSVNNHHLGVAACNIHEVYPFVIMDGCIQAVEINIEKEENTGCSCHQIDNCYQDNSFSPSDAYFSACDCGQNISIDGNGTTAKRMKAFNCGLVLLKPCLRAHRKLKIKCTRTNNLFDGFLRIGLLSKIPKNLTSASSIYNMRCDVFLDGNQVFYKSKVRQKSDTFTLEKLRFNSCLTISMDVQNDIYLQINDESAFLWYSCPASTHCYVVLDVYGACEEISIL
ncbi:neuralized-like protein 4 isoform X2 [Hydractinia symbiolongicarpus]|uniref:neuralized-like protein 4 isoform X2 n=1 Tax=Hydractinia symbiolongicarpus TaxID=13093 RepID=UPI0025506956|nr:neuralized-like protein 4 isoform X2 [Hydractinia symbiolongicarpus]